jgi:benzoyl-CoA reductase/2-hydroxyglutaryl-CoA dehydratase subunit BcrC/BadD/HgdB
MKTAKDFARWRNALTSEYYEELKRAHENGVPVAYITGYMPQEILYAMGILPAYPENYAPLVCAQGYSHDLCQLMEERGYSPELCGYSKATMGSMFAGDGPFGGLPKPDVLISCSNMCGSHPLWWEITSRYYKVPHFLLDAPHTNAQPQRQHIDYFISQMKEMIHFLEKELGITLSEEALRKAVELSDEANAYYIEILEMMKNKPSPLSFRDLCGHVFPVCVLSGDDKAVHFYRKLRDFMREKVNKKKGVIENERYRLAWDNIPIWHDIPLINYLEDNKAAVVYSTYAGEVWGKRLDPDRPFESMAKKYLAGWVDRFVGDQIDIYQQAIAEYSLDGVIFFVNRGCRPFTTGQYDLARALREKIGLPSLMIEGNMADPRGYSKTEVRRMVDEFLELMD